MFEKTQPLLRSLCIAILAGLLLVAPTSAQATKQQPSASDRINRATKQMQSKQLYKLQYKLKKGETIRFTTEQSVATKFSMAGELEESSSRSLSAKTWKVVNVDRLGQITFSLALDSINMWQKTGEGDPIAYDSTKDKEVPDEYSTVADSVGKTLAIFTVSPAGKVINRKSNMRENNFGVGKVTIPLPEQPIPIGYQWNVPTLIQATDDHDKNIQLKARVNYELDKVTEHTAYIRFRTEVLTPVTSEKVKSTIMQKMTKGEIAFDMQAGRPKIKVVRWNEKAQGFEGPDSFLEYVGKMSERLVADTPAGSGPQTAALAPIKEAVAKKPVEIKTRDGQPVLRK